MKLAEAGGTQTRDQISDTGGAIIRFQLQFFADVMKIE